MDQSAYFEQMRNKRKTEILCAARKLMLAFGPDAFNMQQLARTLDISTVTLYKYYKNSDDIVLALQQDILQDLEFTLKHKSDNLTNYLTHIYMTALEHREDMTLLFLFDVHNRYLESAHKIENPFFAFEGDFYSAIKAFLSQQCNSSEESIIQKAHFIHNLFTAQIRQIALMDDTLWKAQKKALAGQIHTLIDIVKTTF